MIVDRSWMKINSLSKEYKNRVIQFFDFAKKNLSKNSGIFWCPCKKCFNMKKHTRDVIFNHCGCD